MPFYEYECPSCRYYAEVLQKISEAPLRKCPSCGKGGFKRLISAPVFRLKGSGWYETDFKSDKENKRNLVGEEREPAAATSGDDKGKPAADAASTAGKGDAKADKTAAPKAAPVKASAVKRSAAAPARRRAKTPAQRPVRKPAAKKRR